MCPNIILKFDIAVYCSFWRYRLFSVEIKVTFHVKGAKQIGQFTTHIIIIQYLQTLLF